MNAVKWNNTYENQSNMMAHIGQERTLLIFSTCKMARIKISANNGNDEHDALAQISRAFVAPKS